MEGHAATRVGWEVTIGVTIHDRMSNLRPNRVGGGHSRHALWARFEKSATKKAFMARNWGEWLNLNSKGTIKLTGLASKQHMVI